FFDDAFSFQNEKFFFRIHSLEQRTSFFHKHLKIEPLNEESNIIILTLEGPLVELSKDFLNAHIETYKKRKKEIAVQKVKTRLEYLNKRIFEILSFTHKESNGKPGFNDSLLTDSLPIALWSDLEEKRMQSQREKRFYEVLLQKLEEGENPKQIEDLKKIDQEIDPVLDVLLVKYVHLLEEKEDLALKTVKKGPLWQLNQMGVNKTFEELKGHLHKRVDSLYLQLAEIRKELQRISGSEQENEIPKEFSEEYEQLLEARSEVIRSLESVSSDAEVIENARLVGRNPVEPKKSFILLIAVIAGLGIPAGVIVFQDFLNQKMTKPLDIESGTNIPVLGFITHHDKEDDYLISSEYDSDLYDSFRYVRKKMHYLNEGHSLQLIGLTSSDSGEGKTFCATNLAVSLADGGYSTLLVDLDLRRPRVNRYFKNKSEKGLVDYLSEDSGSIFDLIFQTNVDHLSVLPAGKLQSNPLELLKGNKLIELIKDLRQEFDYIIMDTPPVGLVSDFTLLMKHTDLNIYLVRESTTQAHALNWINGIFDRKEMTNIGLLINDVKPGNISVYPK
ncbi:MAG: polysaccharide biosynthesis tyrosine autokinase, partial [Bacteroidetes bacterium]|nr:polysaccharide biosynthesis tyrosine autokinase [Bacteroidota bacterium]